MAKPEKSVVKKDEVKPFSMGGEVKVDNRGRDFVYEVKHAGVTIEWTANVSEALLTAKQSIGSKLYKINMQSGMKTLHA